MGLLDRFRPHIEKAKEKAQDPEFQAKVKKMAKEQADKHKRQQGQWQPQRRAFTGGPTGSPGYPYAPGHPLYGQYAHPGFYDNDGQWYDQDSDGDGIPDSQDSTPYGEPEQVYDPGDQQQYDESSSPSGSEMGGYDDPQQEVYSDVEDRGSHSEDYGTSDDYSDQGSLSDDASYSGSDSYSGGDSYSDSGGGDYGGDSGGGGDGGF